MTYQLREALRLAVMVRNGNVVSLTLPDGAQAEDAFNAIQAALTQPLPDITEEPSAYFKHWWDGEYPRCRVDMTDVCEPWLDALNPTITPLFARSTVAGNEGEASLQKVQTSPSIPPGMVRYGPQHPDYPNAPTDWDHGPYLCRDGELYHMRGYGWKHGEFCSNPTSDWDRIAYTSTAKGGW